MVDIYLFFLPLSLFMMTIGNITCMIRNELKKMTNSWALTATAAVTKFFIKKNKFKFFFSTKLTNRQKKLQKVRVFIQS